MATVREAKRLRVYLDEDDKSGGRPVYEVLVYEAHRQGLAGATVLRGSLGFGIKHHIHSSKILDISDDLPVVVEIVDSAENIAAFLPTVEALVSEGIATTEIVELIRYGSADAGV
jgi:PII-like signaling protein